MTQVAAAATLRLSITPNMGISTMRSAAALRASGTPTSSAPITNMGRGG